MCANAGRGDAAWLRKIRPWWDHTDHLHVRLNCPKGAPGCVDQDPLPPGDGCKEAIWWVTEALRAARPQRPQGAAEAAAHARRPAAAVRGRARGAMRPELLAALAFLFWPQALLADGGPRLELDAEVAWEEADPRFGGYSALALEPDGGSFLTISDKGTLGAGRDRAQGRPHRRGPDDRHRRSAPDLGGPSSAATSSTPRASRSTPRAAPSSPSRPSTASAATTTSTGRRPTFPRIPTSASCSPTPASRRWRSTTPARSTPSRSAPAPGSAPSRSTACATASGTARSASAATAPSSSSTPTSARTASSTCWSATSAGFGASPPGCAASRSARTASASEVTLLETPFGELDNMEGISTWRDDGGADPRRR